MIKSVDNVTTTPSESAWASVVSRNPNEDLPLPSRKVNIGRVKFKRQAQYITFNAESANVIIALQPVRQDPKLSPRRLVLVAILPDKDKMANLILDQVAK